MQIDPSYSGVLLSMLVVALLLLVQLLVADVIGLMRKHEPGTPIAASHDDLLFRASRAIANSNESVAIFVLLALAGMFSEASPWFLNLGCGLYVTGRLGHMVCYYADLRLARSVSFALALVGLGVLAVTDASFIL